MMNDEATKVAFAAAYRAAALAGADMRLAADALEDVRDGLLAANRPFDVWNTLDDRIGEAHRRPDQPALLTLREWFVRRVADDEVGRVRRELAADPEAGWRALLAAFAAAASQWRRAICWELVRAELEIPAGHEEEFAVLREGTRLFLHERWPETLEFFDLLAAQEHVPAGQRGRLERLLGQIELYHLQRNDEAERRFGRAVELAPDDPYSLVGQGELRLHRGELSEAEAFFRQAVERDPLATVAYCNMGDCCREEGDDVAAEEWYREAVRRRPGDSLGYVQLCQLQRVAELPEGEDGSIADLVERARTVEPLDEYRIYLDVGSYAQQRNELDAAHGWYRKAMELDPERLGAYVWEAYLFLEEERPDEARRFFRKAMEVAPEAIDGAWGLATWLEQESDWAGAERWYREALSRRRQWRTIIRSKIALMAWRQGRREEAEAELLEVLEAHPDDEFTLSVVERVVDDTARDLDDLEGALRLCREVRALLGEAHEARFRNQVGNLHHARQDYLAAVGAYREAIAADPGRTIYYSNLARTYRAMQAWDEGERLYREAPPSIRSQKAFCSEISSILNDEGNEHYARGDHAEAVRLYEEAIELDPEDAVLHANLAGALEQERSGEDGLGRLDRAVAEMRTACRHAPDRADYRRRLERLEAMRHAAPFYGVDAVGRAPVVTPIAVEIGRDLIPMVEGDAGGFTPGFGRLIDAMRERLRDGYGIQIPAIRVRGNEVHMPPRAYLVMFMEVPLVMGTLELDPVSAGEGPAAGVLGEGVPREGEEPPGSPEPREPAEAREATGAPEPMAPVVDHLAALLEANLAEFVGNQEVHDLLELVPEPVRERISGTPGLLPRLTGVVRGLVAEQVPIIGFAAICERFLELTDAGRSPVEIVEDLRKLPGIREALPGSGEGTRRYSLGSDLTSLLVESIRGADGFPLLAMLPEPCQEALSAVRAEVSGGPDEALVVESGTLRPFLRKLVELEWPELRVLSADELPADPTGRTVGEIRLEP